MAKGKQKKKTTKEPDSLFFLKMVALLIIGSQWLFISPADKVWQVPIPFGLILGLVMVTHEHFQIDRKIEYVILLLSSFIAFWLPVGIVIQL